MSLKKYSREELEQMPMIELADLILLDKKKAINFRDIFDEIAKLKDLPDEGKEERLTQFYTNLTMDGRFMTTGSGIWGLKRWYPVEQMDEEISGAPKKKKKATKTKTKAKPKTKKKKEETATKKSESKEKLDEADGDTTE